MKRSEFYKALGIELQIRFGTKQFTVADVRKSFMARPNIKLNQMYAKWSSHYEFYDFADRLKNQLRNVPGLLESITKTSYKKVHGKSIKYRHFAYKFNEVQMELGNVKHNVEVEVYTNPSCKPDTYEILEARIADQKDEIDRLKIENARLNHIIAVVKQTFKIADGLIK